MSWKSVAEAAEPTVVATLAERGRLTAYLWDEIGAERREKLLRGNLENDQRAIEQCAESIKVCTGRARFFETNLLVHRLEIALRHVEGDPHNIILGILKQHRRKGDDYRLSEKQIAWAQRLLREIGDDSPTIEADE